MRAHLARAVWLKPDDCKVALAGIEAALLQKPLSPLNVKDVVTPWTAQVKAARKGMADQARTWM
jgi:hypothetical protein